MKILFVGDIAGRPGRNMLENNLAKLQWEHGIDFTVINGENSSGGRGLRRDNLRLYNDLGIDAITMGNHVWDHRDIFELLKSEPKIVRPANLPDDLPGSRYGLFSCCGLRIAVINLLGQVYMNGALAVSNPFIAAQQLLGELREQADVILVDFHAEATSEKTALGFFLDGQVTAVLGTHTHIQTNDARLLPRGTAYITDVGMTGVLNSCLGMAHEAIVERFVTGLPVKMTVAEGECILCGVVLDIDNNGRAKSIIPISLTE